MKIMFMSEGEEKVAAKKDLFENKFPQFLEVLSSKCLLADSKFLCGDNLSIYDMIVGGFFTNYVLYTNGRLHDGY